MEDANGFLDVPSPANTPYQHLYGDHDQYVDNSRSESHSSATSPYDMAFSGDFTSTNAFPSPESRDADDGCDSPPELVASEETAAEPKAAAKKKRENRYKNAPPSVLSRRRAQNRASQRAYRERKDQRIKDLEQMLQDARARNNILSHAYAELQMEYVKLKSSPPTPAPLGMEAHDGRNAHSTQRQLPTTMNTSSYATIPNSSMSTGMSGAYVDAASMAVLNAGHDLDAYLYPEMGSYAL